MPWRCASGATRNCPQYQNPTKTVTRALQRNQFRAGKVKFWKILGLAAASTCFMKGTLIRLKKYSRPTQAMPAIMWNQRSMSWAASLPVMVGITYEAVCEAAEARWCMHFLRRIGFWGCGISGHSLVEGDQ